MNVQGLMVPVITPRENGKLDVESLQKLLRFLVDSCVDSIFIIGTTGEFQYISFEEKKEVIQVASETTDGRITLLAGISSLNNTEMLSIIRASEERNVGALVLAPMFAAEKPEIIIDTVLENSSLPLLLYNNPVIHRDEMLPIGIVKDYAVHPKVIGIKDSSGDWEYFNQLLELQNEEFSVLQGKESQILDSLQAGADGIVAAAAQINPDLFCDIIYSPDEAIMEEILSIKSELDMLADDSIAAVKTKLVQMGIITSADTFK